MTTTSTGRMAPDRTTVRRVEAQNNLNRAAMLAAANVRDILAPYVGRKVRKISGHGGWVAALDRQLQTFYSTAPEIYGTGTRVWVSCRYRWVSVEIQRQHRDVDGGHLCYLKQDLPVAVINEETGELERVNDPVELITSYTAEWLEHTRREARELENRARDLRHAMREFER